ncbi:MAG: creatininase family protein [Anaerolineae bacterium]
MLDWTNTWTDIEAAAVTTAVVPVGALEQHGTSLPLGCDTVLTAKVAEAVATELGAYLLPALPIGTSATHLSFRGTVTLSHETLAAVLSDVVDSLVRTQFRTVLLVSLHFGNYVVWSDLPQRLSARYPGTRVVALEPRPIWAEACRQAGIATPGLHCDEAEASLLLYLRPDLVGSNPTDCPEYEERLESVPRTETGFPQDVRQVSPSGALGQPSLATREKGERLWRVMLPLLVADARQKVSR